MTIYPNRIYDAAMARRAHEAKPVIPPLPSMEIRPEYKNASPIDRLCMIRDARRRWEEAYQRWLAEMELVSQRAETTARRVGYGRRADNDKVGYNQHGARVEICRRRRHGLAAVGR